MKSSELLKEFKKAGWYEVRQSGSHKIMKHPDHEDSISLPFHGSKEVGTGLAKKLMKQAGINK
jgi:predicted RNA binding protein YcfA (HicA-like mRNA interferase family)